VGLLLLNTILDAAGFDRLVEENVGRSTRR
jgi:hypothetical protein